MEKKQEKLLSEARKIFAETFTFLTERSIYGIRPEQDTKDSLKLRKKWENLIKKAVKYGENKTKTISS